jgi:hypothetical protein
MVYNDKIQVIADLTLKRKLFYFFFKSLNMLRIAIGCHHYVYFYGLITLGSCQL